MKYQYNPKYPAIEDLKKKAQRRIPKFAFEYLDGGCNEDVNLHKNTDEIRQVELLPEYLRAHKGSDIKMDLFGHTYDAPFGIAPVGLQGLIWPNSPEILAKAAFEHNIPFILSTVSTSSIERISEITEGRAWFQLYHPAENSLRDKILQRAEAAHCPVLVILSDVPTFGYRPRDIRNGLAMPPRMTLSNILQIMGRQIQALRRQADSHKVNLKPFYISATEITNAQYARFLKATGHKKPLYWEDQNLNGPNQPVVGVTWNDAAAFCRWLTKRLPERPMNSPTENQWDRSPGGLVGQPYPWGNQAPDAGDVFRANFRTSLPGATGFSFTAPVGSFPANGYGLFDLAGNVSEWCQDRYVPLPTGGPFQPGSYASSKGLPALRPPGPAPATPASPPPLYADGYIRLRVVRLPSLTCFHHFVPFILP